MIHSQSRKIKRQPRQQSQPADSLDSLDQLIAELYASPGMLTAEEERALGRRIQAHGDQDAVDELVRKNIRFVISIAQKYQGHGVSLPDLIQDGNVGLVIAARRFDPDAGAKFISYAVWWIRQTILAGISNHGRAVRLPTSQNTHYLKINRAHASLAQQFGREPTDSEISEVTGLPLSAIEDVAQFLRPALSLDQRFDTTGSETPSTTKTELATPEISEKQVLARDLHERIESALSNLAPRDAKILRLYFGLGADEPMTLQQIGDILGITRERVRQLKDRALSQMREVPELQALAQA